MPDISEIFGGGKLSYEEFIAKAGEAGADFGDVNELKVQHEAEIMSIRAQNELDRELDRAGVKNRELVTKLIDMQNVTVDGDGVHGIAEQLEALETSAPYLFEDRQAKSVIPKLRIGMPHKTEANDADSMDDREFYKRVKKM